MLKHTFLLTFLSIPTVAMAGQVNHLDVNGNMVVFGTDAAKSAASPACMDAANADKWAVSLNSESGRAIYSMLMTATVTKMAVTVESAGDCADQPGFERAIGVELDAAASSQNSAKVEWAGYTYPVNGQFPRLNGGRGNPFIEGSKLCNAAYPGSRLMLWEDYIQIHSEYPMTEDIWAVGFFQTQMENRLIMKTGNAVSYSESTNHGYGSCYGWSSQGQSHMGAYMNTYGGQIILSKCNNKYRLACVK